MNYLTQKVTLINSVTKDVSEYVVKLSPLVSSNLPTKIKKVHALNLEISKTMPSISKITDETKLFIALESIKNTLTDLNEIFNELHETRDSYGSDLSDTYKAEVNRMYEKLSMKYKKAFMQMIVLDDMIIKEIGEPLISKIKISNTKLDDFQIFRKMFHANHSAINLYLYVCRALIKFFKNSDRDFMYKIFNMVEEDKTLVLGNVVETKKKIKKNPMLKTFGLIPNGDFMTIVETVSKVFSQKLAGSAEKLSSFEAAAKKNKTCIVILNKITNMPIYFDIQKLISKEDAADYIQPDEVGVTKNTVTRFNTIRFLDPVKKWDFSAATFGDKKFDKFLLLETFDGKTFRNLNLWIGTSQYVVPGFRIREFLMYLEQYQNNKLYSSRIDLYNGRTSEAILKHIYFPRSINISVLTDESTEIDARYLRRTMTDKMMTVFIKKSKSIKNNVALSQLVKSDIFSDMFSTILVEYYDEYRSKKTMQRHKFSQSAILIDFLHQLKQLTGQFTKEMQANTNEFKMDATTYKTPQKMFEAVLLASLDTIVVDKKNLYQQMLFKDKLLSI